MKKEISNDFTFSNQTTNDDKFFKMATSSTQVVKKRSSKDEVQPLKLDANKSAPLSPIILASEQVGKVATKKLLDYEGSQLHFQNKKITPAKDGTVFINALDKYIVSPSSGTVFNCKGIFKTKEKGADNKEITKDKATFKLAFERSENEEIAQKLEEIKAQFIEQLKTQESGVFASIKDKSAAMDQYISFGLSSNGLTEIAQSLDNPKFCNKEEIAKICGRGTYLKLVVTPSASFNTISKHLCVFFQTCVIRIVEVERYVSEDAAALLDD